MFISLGRETFSAVFTKFMIRRYFRIAPLFYLVVFIVWAFFQQVSTANLIAHMLFIGNIRTFNMGSLWYVNVSMQLYFFTPFLVFCCNEMGNKTRITFLLSVTSIMYMLTFKYGIFTISRGSSYVLGILFFYIQHEFNKSLTENKGTILITSAAILILLS